MNYKERVRKKDNIFNTPSPLAILCPLARFQRGGWLLRANGFFRLFCKGPNLLQVAKSKKTQFMPRIERSQESQVLGGNNLGINESQDFSFLRIVIFIRMLNILDFVIIDPSGNLLVFFGRFDLVSFGQDPGIPLALGFLDL